MNEQWIDVADSLPSDMQSVAFVVSTNNSAHDYLNGMVLGGVYRAGEFGGFSVPGMTFTASYWLPLPDAPAAR